MGKLKLSIADIAIILSSVGILISDIGIAYLYVSAYILLIILTIVKGLISSKFHEKNETLVYDFIYKMFLVAYLIGLTFLLFSKLNIILR